MTNEPCFTLIPFDYAIGSKSKETTSPQFFAALIPNTDQELELTLGVIDTLDKLIKEDNCGDSLLCLPPEYVEFTRISPKMLIETMTSSNYETDDSGISGNKYEPWSSSVKASNKILETNGFSPLIICSSTNPHLIVGVEPLSKTEETEASLIKVPSQSMEDSSFSNIPGWKYRGHAVTSVVIDIGNILDEMSAYFLECKNLKTKAQIQVELPDFKLNLGSISIIGYITVPQFLLVNINADLDEFNSMYNGQISSQSRKGLLYMYSNGLLFPNPKIQVFSLDSSGVRFASCTQGSEKMLGFYSLLDCVEHDRIYQDQLESWELKVKQILNTWKQSHNGNNEEFIATEYGGTLILHDDSDFTSDDSEGDEDSSQVYEDIIKIDNDNHQSPILSIPNTNSQPQHFFSFEIPDGFPSNIYLPPKPLHQPVVLQPVWTEFLGNIPAFFPYPLSWYLSCPFSALPSLPPSQTPPPPGFRDIILNSVSSDVFPYGKSSRESMGVMDKSMSQISVPNNLVQFGNDTESGPNSSQQDTYLSDRLNFSSDTSFTNYEDVESASSFISQNHSKISGFEENLDGILDQDDIYDQSNRDEIVGSSNFDNSGQLSFSNVSPKLGIFPPEIYNYGIHGQILGLFWLDPYGPLDGAVYRLISKLEQLGDISSNLIDYLHALLDEDTRSSRSLLICEYAVIDIELMTTRLQDDTWWFSTSDIVGVIPNIIQSAMIPLDHTYLNQSSPPENEMLTPSHILLPRMFVYQTGKKFLPKTATSAWSWFTGTDQVSSLLLGSKDGLFCSLRLHLTPYTYSVIIPALEKVREQGIQLIKSTLKSSQNIVGKSSETSSKIETMSNSDFNVLKTLLTELEKFQQPELGEFSSLNGIQGIPSYPCVLDPFKILSSGTESQAQKFQTGPLDQIQFNCQSTLSNCWNNVDTPIAWVQTRPSSPLVWIGYTDGSWVMVFLDSCNDSTAKSRSLLARVVQNGIYASSEQLESCCSFNSELSSTSPSSWKSFCFLSGQPSHEYTCPFSDIPYFVDFASSPYMASKISFVSVTKNVICCGLLGNACIDSRMIYPTQYMFHRFYEFSDPSLNSSTTESNLPLTALSDSNLKQNSKSIDYQFSLPMSDSTRSENQLLDDSKPLISSNTSISVDSIEPNLADRLRKLRLRFREVWINNRVYWNLLPDSVSSDLRQGHYSKYAGWMEELPESLFSIEKRLIDSENLRILDIDQTVSNSLNSSDMGRELDPNLYIKKLNQEVCAVLLPIADFIIDECRWDSLLEKNKSKSQEIAKQILVQNKQSLLWMESIYKKHYFCYETPLKILKPILHKLNFHVETFPIHKHALNSTFIPSPFLKDVVGNPKLLPPSQNFQEYQSSILLFFDHITRERILEIYSPHVNAGYPISKSNLFDSTSISKSSGKYDSVRFPRSKSIASWQKIEVLQYDDRIFPQLSWLREPPGPGDHFDKWTKSASDFSKSSQTESTNQGYYLASLWSNECWKSFSQQMLNNLLIDFDEDVIPQPAGVDVQNQSNCSFQKSDVLNTPLGNDSTLLFYLPHELDSIPKLQFQWMMLKRAIFHLKSTFNSKFEQMFKAKLDLLQRIRSRNDHIRECYDSISRIWEIMYFERLQHAKQMERAYSKIIEAFPSPPENQEPESLQTLSQEYPPTLWKWPLTTCLPFWNSIQKSLTSEGTSSDGNTKSASSNSVSLPKSSQKQKQSQSENNNESKTIENSAKIPFPGWKIFDLVPSDLSIDENPDILFNCLQNLLSSISTLEQQLDNNEPISISITQSARSSVNDENSSEEIDPDTVLSSGITHKDTERALISMMHGKLTSDEESDQILNLLYLPLWMCAPGLPFQMEGFSSNDTSIISGNEISERHLAAVNVFSRQCEDLDPGEELISSQPKTWANFQVSEDQEYFVTFWNVFCQIHEKSRLSKLAEIESGESVEYEPEELEPIGELPTCIWDLLSSHVSSTMTETTFENLTLSYVAAAASTYFPMVPPRNVKNQVSLLNQFLSSWVGRHQSRLFKISSLAHTMISDHKRNIADITLFNSLFMKSFFLLRKWTDSKLAEFSSLLSASEYRLFSSSRLHPSIPPALPKPISSLKQIHLSQKQRFRTSVPFLDHDSIQKLMASSPYHEPTIHNTWSSLSQAVASNSMFQVTEIQLSKLQRWLQLAMNSYLPVAEYRIRAFEEQCSQLKVQLKNSSNDLKSLTKKRKTLLDNLPHALFTILEAVLNHWSKDIEIYCQNFHNSDKCKSYPIPEPHSAFTGNLVNTWVTIFSLSRSIHTLSLFLTNVQQEHSRSINKLRARTQEKNSLNIYIAAGTLLLSAVKSNSEIHLQNFHYLVALQHGQVYMDSSSFAPFVASYFENLLNFESKNTFQEIPQTSNVQSESQFEYLAFCDNNSVDSGNDENGKLPSTSSLMLINLSELGKYNSSQREKQKLFSSLLKEYFTIVSTHREMGLALTSLKHSRVSIEQLKRDLNFLKVSKTVQAVANGLDMLLLENSLKENDIQSFSESKSSRNEVDNSLKKIKNKMLNNGQNKLNNVQDEIAFEEQQLENSRHNLRIFWSAHPEALPSQAQMVTPRELSKFFDNRANEVKRLVSVSSFQKRAIASLKDQLKQLGINEQNVQ